MRILVSYRGIPQSPGWATGDMVVKAFRALGHEVYPYAKYYQENRWVEEQPALDRHDWDLVLFMECNDGEPQYPELRITRARQKACWFFDTSYHEDRYTKLVKYFEFDHHFLANPLTIQEYNVWEYPNVHYLPYACDRELHGRSLEYAKTRDVVLVGSIRDDRVALVDALTEYDVDLQLIGGVFREEYIDTLASARIVVNQNPIEGRGLLNMRFWETPAAGSFILTDADDLVAQPIDDKAHQRIGMPYMDVQDIAGFCRQFIIDYPEHLVHFARINQAHVFKYHTYTNRCETILETVFPYG